MKTKKACNWILMMALMVSLLGGCGGNAEPYVTSGGGRASGDKSTVGRTSGKTGNSEVTTPGAEMPFNGDVTFHDMHVTIPKSFIRDSTQSSEDVWVFERRNYTDYIMLFRGALEMQGGLTTPENYCEIMQAGGAESEVTDFQGLPCVYTVSIANNGMYATEAVVFVNDTTYALTMCTKNEADMEEYETIYASLSFDVISGAVKDDCDIRALTSREAWAEYGQAYDRVFLDLGGGSDGTEEVTFAVDAPVEHVKLYSITVAAGDGDIRYIGKQRDYRFRLLPEELFCVTLPFFGSMPNNGISYFSEEDGEEHFFTITQSGRDGTIELSETEPFETDDAIDEQSVLGYWTKLSIANTTVGALSFAADGTFVYYGTVYDVMDDPDAVIVSGMYVRGEGTWRLKGAQGDGFLYELHCEADDVPEEILVSSGGEGALDAITLSWQGDEPATYYQYFF